MPNPLSKSVPAGGALYTAEQVRNLDHCAIHEHGIPGIKLMKHAGRTAFEILLKRWPQPDAITVLCGSGNNGGDGYIIAALAAQRRIPVTVAYVADPEGLNGDAKLAYEFARREGVIMMPFDACMTLQGVVVDALLGTGLKGEVRDAYGSAITAINNSGLPVLAVDIPSGLSADTGAELGCSVRADITVTFIGMKQGLVSGAGPARCGDLVFDDLAVPAEVYSGTTPSAELLQLPALLQEFPERERDAHKGRFGHVMVVGGDSGYAGAALMAAEASARTGAGLTSVATRPEHVAPMVSRRPELMVLGVNSGTELEPVLERASVFVLGPGLGRTAWSEQLLQRVLATSMPLVLDADGLNLLAQGIATNGEQRENWVLTPHPGEAARLLNCDIKEVQADRFAAVRKLQQQFGGVVLLKGAGTVIADQQGQVSVSPWGNPGMASGGMGDVLSGVIGSLIAQGLPLDLAAKLGVGVHAAAADVAALEEGERGLLATDLLPHIRQFLNGMLNASDE